MVIGKAKPSRFVRRAMQTPAQQTETGNVRSRGERPITEATIRLLNRKVPNDLRGRLFVDLIVEALVGKAIKGDVRAIKEITNRVEGGVPLTRQGERDERPPITVIWDTPTPSRKVTSVSRPISAMAG